MTQRHYLHAAAHGLTGTFPSGEQDSQAPSFSATGATTLRAMDAALGSSMVNLSATTAATTANQAGFMGMWTTAPLSGDQTVGGASQTLTVNVADYESNLSANFYINRAHVYVWRPSTGALVGDCCTYATAPSGGAPAEPTGSSSAQVTSFVVDLAAVSALSGDVVIVELWANFTQAAAAAYTARLYYDGSTVTATENTVVSDHAAYVEFSQNLTFVAPDAQLTNQSAIAWFESTETPEAQLTNQSAIAWFESAETPEAQLVNQTVIVWYELANTPAHITSIQSEVLSINENPPALITAIQSEVLSATAYVAGVVTSVQLEVLCTNDDTSRQPKVFVST